MRDGVRLVRLRLLAIACVAAGMTMAAEYAEELVGEWVVSDIAGVSVLEASKPRLGFDDQGRFSATAGCNRLASSYETADGRISLGNVAATRMMCPDPLMEQEAALLQVLEEVNGFQIEGDTLSLFDDSGDVRLVAARQVD